MLIDTNYDGELSPVESDPRLQELVMRQRKVMSELTSRQAQEYVRLALTIRKELQAQDESGTPACITCGKPLTVDDPAVTTLGPRCARHF